MKTVKVSVNGKDYEVKLGTTYAELAERFAGDFKSPIILAKVNNNLKELHKTISESCEVSFVDMLDKDGYRTYQRSISFLLIVAAKQLFEKADLTIQYSLGAGYYAEFDNNFKLDEAKVKKLEKKMNEYIATNANIEKVVLNTSKAIQIFKKQGMHDKVDLLKYRRASNINLYFLDGFYDYFYGYMLKDTKHLSAKFKLYLYGKGLVIQFIDKKNPTEVGAFRPSPMLHDTLQENTEWGNSIAVENVAHLNNRIVEGDFSDLMLMQEAYMEKRIGIVADKIISNDKNKFIFIAGPSSSGKTTFSKRLSVQLAALGANPKPVFLDDYYVNRKDNPVDENGNYDFECLEAIDVKQFNADMTAMLSGKEIQVPKFDFVKGEREYDGTTMSLNNEDILVIEGLHGLNPKLSELIPDENKFKVYISALTALNVDEHNRIPTTDARLLRRIVRDNRERGKSAAKTISMWPSVRAGEEKYIFPFQEQADIIFNSSLIYELSILKQFVEPLLFKVEPGTDEYIEAKRLIKFLGYFLGITSENVPSTSLLREFIGGSYFYQ